MTKDLFKSSIINILTLVLGIGLMSGSISEKKATAVGSTEVPEIKITHLGNYRNQYLNVLYVIGSRPILATSDKNLIVHEVKKQLVFEIQDDTEVVPRTEIEKVGNNPAYNYILFVVSPHPEFSWVNQDGSLPKGMKYTRNNMIFSLKNLTKSEVDRGTNSIEF